MAGDNFDLRTFRHVAVREGQPMAPLVDRTEFRAVVKEVVRCLHQNLDVRGLAPLTAEQIMFWLQNVTVEDLKVVTAEIDADNQKE
jgi:hypothetical protein